MMSEFGVCSRVCGETFYACDMGPGMVELRPQQGTLLPGGLIRLDFEGARHVRDQLARRDTVRRFFVVSLRRGERAGGKPVLTAGDLKGGVWRSLESAEETIGNSGTQEIQEKDQ